MQPYFLPYLGYWELLAAVDKFVILDDVNFITRGWINRNKISIGGQSKWITLPVVKASQNKRICDLSLVGEDRWKRSLLAKMREAYRTAPYSASVMALLEQILSQSSAHLSDFLFGSLERCASYLDIKTEIIPTSRCIPKKGLSGQDRIIDICKVLNAREFVNLSGGSQLYDRTSFEMNGLQLRFLKYKAEYDDLKSSSEGEPLSVIDALMLNHREKVLRSISC